MTRVSSAMDSTPGFKGLQKCNQQEDERKDSGQHGSNDGPWQSTPLTVRPNSAHLDSVPKRLCRKREGQKPKQQSTQQHASLTPGRPGTSWHVTHRGSYMSSPPGMMTGLSHGAGLPSISRWVRVAGAPQRAQMASSNDTESAIASAQVMAGNSMARKSVSNPATMIGQPQDNTEGTSCRMSSGSKNCASSMATSVPSRLCANAVKMSSAEATGVAGIDVPLRLHNCAPSLSAPNSCTKTLVSRPSACACRTSRISSAVFPLRIGPVMTWRPITSHPPLNPTLAQPRPSGTPVRDRRYANGSADTNGPRLVQTRHRLGGVQPPAPRCGSASPVPWAIRSTKITSLDVGYNKSNFSASQRMGNTSMMDKINQTGSPAKTMHMKTRHLMPHQNQYTKTTSCGCPATRRVRWLGAEG